MARTQENIARLHTQTQALSESIAVLAHGESLSPEDLQRFNRSLFSLETILSELESDRKVNSATIRDIRDIHADLERVSGNLVANQTPDAEDVADMQRHLASMIQRSEFGGLEGKGGPSKLAMIMSSLALLVALSVAALNKDRIAAIAGFGAEEDKTEEVVPEEEDEKTGIAKVIEERDYHADINTRGDQQTANIIGRNSSNRGYSINVTQDDAGRSSMLLPGVNGVDGHDHTRFVVTGEEAHLVESDHPAGFENPNTTFGDEIRRPASTEEVKAPEVVSGDDEEEMEELPAPKGVDLGAGAPAEDGVSPAERKTMRRIARAESKKAVEAYDADLKKTLDTIRGSIPVDLEGDPVPNTREADIKRIVEVTMKDGFVTREQFDQLADALDEMGVKFSRRVLWVECIEGRPGVVLPEVRSPRRR